jgi:hypothetical protein
MELAILMLFCHLRLSLLSVVFLSGFPIKNLYAFLICPMRSTHLAHLILVDLIMLIAFGEAYNLWHSSLCSFLQPDTLVTAISWKINSDFARPPCSYFTFCRDWSSRKFFFKDFCPRFQNLPLSDTILAPKLEVRTSALRVGNVYSIELRWLPCQVSWKFLNWMKSHYWTPTRTWHQAKNAVSLLHVAAD